MTNRKVGYVYSEVYNQLVDRLPSNINRASQVHSLIEAYGLLSHMTLLKPHVASNDQLALFHDRDYIEALLSDEDQDIDHDEEFGLQFDCPRFQGLSNYVRLLGGASIVSADALILGECDLVFHWQGGRHHAQIDQASGFCYFNDVVSSIIRLRSHFKRVLCIDVDVHHGDGTQNAFIGSNQVYTVSIHRFEDGFFPGTGRMEERGIGRGLNHNFNIPLKQGLTNSQFDTIFEKTFDVIKSQFQPDVVVLVMGADGLAADPTKSWNLTNLDICLKSALNINLPLLILGSGGYNAPNTARCWTKLTAMGCGLNIENEIPEHCHNFYKTYAPTFELSIQQSFIENKNFKEDIENILQKIQKVETQTYSGRDCNLSSIVEN